MALDAYTVSISLPSILSWKTRLDVPRSASRSISRKPDHAPRAISAIAIASALALGYIADGDAIEPLALLDRIRATTWRLSH